MDPLFAFRGQGSKRERQKEHLREIAERYLRLMLYGATIPMLSVGAEKVLKL
jgi:hypothetical protein